MLVETVGANGPDLWELGLVGQRSRQFSRVALDAEQIGAPTVAAAPPPTAATARCCGWGCTHLLGIAYEFAPYFALSLSRVDPLPHQLEAVYRYLLKPPSVRFLLADDAGAGKTIMAGLLTRELKLRGLAERIAVVCPANRAFQWQRKLNEKLSETFLVLNGGDIRNQFGANEWQRTPQVITSLRNQPGWISTAPRPSTAPAKPSAKSCSSSNWPPTANLASSARICWAT